MDIRKRRESDEISRFSVTAGGDDSLGYVGRLRDAVRHADAVSAIACDDESRVAMLYLVGGGIASLTVGTVLRDSVAVA